jgi:hypothetical protein
VLVWLVRDFSEDEVAGFKFAFEKLWREVREPREMLLASTRQPSTGLTTLLVRIPEVIADRFPEFSAITGDQLPTKAECLLGHPDEFKKVFETP